MAIEKIRVDGSPIRLSFKRAHFLKRFASLEASLKKSVDWIFIIPKGFMDFLYDISYIFHITFLRR